MITIETKRSAYLLDGELFTQLFVLILLVTVFGIVLSPLFF